MLSIAVGHILRDLLRPIFHFICSRICALSSSPVLLCWLFNYRTFQSASWNCQGIEHTGTQFACISCKCINHSIFIWFCLYGMYMKCIAWLHKRLSMLCISNALLRRPNCWKLLLTYKLDVEYPTSKVRFWTSEQTQRTHVNREMLVFAHPRLIP